ncbi:MAG: hypothetical protein K2G52_07125 [Muribaculaceae bacterium]|nr:hypothetical protein [Muribaculaceae bacterium]
MKKKLFFGLAFAALAAGGCFLAVNTPPRHQFTTDEIANIEALTAGEGGLTMMCYKNFTPGGLSNMELTCETCSFRFGFNFNTRSRCR